ncbi:MAG: hypothetical protein ACHQ1G_02965 [Planctomycetota bacterium]
MDVRARTRRAYSVLLPLLLLLASCRYVGNRAADFLDQFRGAVGVGTTIGVRGRALGVVDTGLMVGVQPRAAALGWRYGTPLYFSEKDPRMDAEQAEIFRATSVYGLDYATGTYKSARTSIALLPGIFTWTDATPSDYAWLVPENGEDFRGHLWIWNRENRKTNRYARIHAFDIEAEVAILGYIDVGWSPGEFVDFVLGFFLIDIAKDDKRREKP